jgi:hypothetical protein
MAEERADSPIACRMDALSPEQRKRRTEVLSALRTRLAGVGETETGIVFRWSHDDSIVPLLAEFVRWESLCCPFIRFGIDVQEEGGAVELQLSGRTGVKEFLVTTFLQGRKP